MGLNFFFKFIDGHLFNIANKAHHSENNLIFTLDFCGNKAIDIGNAKPNEKVHARVLSGKLRRGKRRSIFLQRTKIQTVLKFDLLISTRKCLTFRMLT